VTLVDGNPVMTPKQETVSLGTTFRVVGTLSADKKHIKLALKYHDKRLARPDVPLVPVTTFLAAKSAEGEDAKGRELVPFTQFLQKPEFRELAFDQTATVSDGGTVAVHAGKQKVQVRRESGVPVLSEIPYLNRLFKNVGVAEVEQEVVVLATAKRVSQVRKEVRVEPLRASPHGTWPAARAFAVLTASSPVVCPSGLTLVRATAVVPLSDKAATLMTQYYEACARGDKDAAMRMAVQALAEDPTCFGRHK
jgi:hypothetical protein